MKKITNLLAVSAVLISLIAPSAGFAYTATSYSTGGSANSTSVIGSSAQGGAVIGSTSQSGAVIGSTATGGTVIGSTAQGSSAVIGSTAINNGTVIGSTPINNGTVIGSTPINTAPVANNNACSDGIDNDGDGKIDYPADPGCLSHYDDGEFNIVTPAPTPIVYQCNDGIDNDNDGKIDMLDPGCGFTTDTSEFNTVDNNPPVYTCGSGYYLSGNTCYPYQNYYNYNYNNTNCGYGYYMSGGTCYPNNNYSNNYYTQPTYYQQPVVVTQPVAPTETRYTPAVSTTQTIVQNVATTPVNNVVVRSNILEISNVRIFNSADNSTIVTWDTSLPASGQVVFGFTSKPANTPYDFTTGWQNDQVTHREMSLGQLELNRVYYIRINADTPSGLLANSAEMTFIPLPSGHTQNTNGTVNIVDGQANAFNIFGLTLGGKALVALLMLIIIAILAAIVIKRRSRMVAYNN